MADTLVMEKPCSGGVLLWLNRPERLNAINAVMLGELMHTLATLAIDSSVSVVVITGAGRGFCSAIDVRDFGPGAPSAASPAIDRMRFQEAMAALPEAIRNLPQPVIAAVNGPCVGAGLALCLAADIRISSTAASFGLHRDRRPAGLRDLLPGLGQRALVLRVGVERLSGQRHPGSLIGQPLGDRLPQPTAAASHQRHHAFTASGHPMLPPMPATAPATTPTTTTAPAPATTPTPAPAPGNGLSLTKNVVTTGAGQV